MVFRQPTRPRRSGELVTDGDLPEPANRPARCWAAPDVAAAGVTVQFLADAPDTCPGAGAAPAVGGGAGGPAPPPQRAPPAWAPVWCGAARCVPSGPAPSRGLGSLFSPQLLSPGRRSLSRRRDTRGLLRAARAGPGAWPAPCARGHCQRCFLLSHSSEFVGNLGRAEKKLFPDARQRCRSLRGTFTVDQKPSRSPDTRLGSLTGLWAQRAEPGSRTQAGLGPVGDTQRGRRRDRQEAPGCGRAAPCRRPAHVCLSVLT